MALTWELTKIKDWKEVCWEPKDENGQTILRSETNALIWSTMGVGMGDLSKENAPEFVARLRVLEKVYGWDEIPTEVVLKHIGLTTNVFPIETRASFLKRHIGYDMDVTKERVKNAIPTRV